MTTAFLQGCEEAQTCDIQCGAGGDGGAGGQGGAGGEGGAGGQGGQGGSGGQGGAGGQGGQGGGGSALCADRTGGALVTFDVVGQSLTVWITNQAFIDEAIQLKEQGTTRIPNFAEVIDGQDCDPKWTFHVDPEKATFVDATIELCDGTPEYVEEHTAEWIDQVKQYCPWNTKVTNVEVRPGTP
ncbi:hypothetical protein KEG38_32740 [Polyangium jinanense]|uniref:BP74-related protein n=1 Tax=Polyangium jinanense TaxID=2829994 RepID=UPI0023409667|nr:hypothetical protein [Polyangium jinanense]MDC3958669.1 hypothetical protein [Polyangium jinanense]